MASDCAAFLLVILTILVPPLAVFITTGCSVDFVINIFLTILGYIPGIIHAFYVEYKYARLEREAAAFEAGTIAPVPTAY
ncbi:hypothetical protein G7K_3340-t1 [Saitoella complicata NRRL Y-17804]|uniref:Stress response RCI peptide n=1 Tax=Saitoella complicata (strain BCRC 22490 / CBS 7301 / JCM 7358 / NBRC 10748 / NRRL Y-17804) TaxID=698492 RepID=A0A0E9NH19_SAICN|nr:hypothetical protein G7K_3340-t1 [Saitoella complicata NRRL Y-17804]